MHHAQSHEGAKFGPFGEIVGSLVGGNPVEEVRNLIKSAADRFVPKPEEKKEAPPPAEKDKSDESEAARRAAEEARRSAEEARKASEEARKAYEEALKAFKDKQANGNAGKKDDSQLNKGNADKDRLAAEEEARRRAEEEAARRAAEEARRRAEEEEARRRAAEAEAKRLEEMANQIDKAAMEAKKGLIDELAKQSKPKVDCKKMLEGSSASKEPKAPPPPSSIHHYENVTPADLAKAHVGEDANKDSYEKEVAIREKQRADSEVRLAIREK